MALRKGIDRADSPHLTRASVAISWVSLRRRPAFSRSLTATALTSFGNIMATPCGQFIHRAGAV